MSEHPDPRAKDDTDVVQDIARELAEVAHQISSLKGEANAYLSDPDYDDLRLRLEMALAAVEAAEEAPSPSDADAMRARPQ